ncbi:sugar phosphate isomerase/epimerase [Treponema sp. OttesenSCG-928-L16]|nr:sugar phosphate isomerase/epimerase [Treponema sp. OttesenSCG-928-L16]
MIQIGLRAHDFGRNTPEALAVTLAQYKPAAIQLALTKAFTGSPGLGGLSPGYARGIYRIFAKRDISIAVLGCYINPVHPDSDERERMLTRFEEHLRYVRDFGCAVVGTETGSCNADCSFHPDTAKPETFDLFCSSLERLLKTAEKCGSIVGIEPVADQHTICSIELMEQLLRRFESPSLKVIYDPVNLIPKAGLEESQESFFKRAFEAFGNHIAAVHLKDFRMEGGNKIGDLPTGTGSLDYRSLLKLISEKKDGVDLLLENNGPQFFAASSAFIREALPRI